MRTEIKLIFKLPENESVNADNYAALMEWFAGAAVQAKLQGIDCEMFVNGEPMELAVDFIGPHVYVGKLGKLCTVCAQPYRHKIHLVSREVS